jgi:MFS family permease
VVIASAQLTVVLDATIVNVALPHVQRALGFSGSDLEWVVNAYAITFGGLLLLGGRAIQGCRRPLCSGRRGPGRRGARTGTRTATDRTNGSGCVDRPLGFLATELTFQDAWLAVVVALVTVVGLGVWVPRADAGRDRDSAGLVGGAVLEARRPRPPQES